MTEHHSMSESNGNVCLHISVLHWSEEVEKAPGFSSQQSKFGHTFFLHIVSVEIQQILWLSIHFLSITRALSHYFLYPQYSCEVVKGRSKDTFFCRWENLRSILNSTLEAYWKSSRKFLFFKSLWSCHIPAQHQNLRVWHPSIDIFQSTHDSKLQLRLRTTGLDNLYSIFKCKCLLPKCSLSTNEEEISFPWTL